MKIAILGAGISGLAAARVLRENGCDVTIWEKSDGVGGRIGTRRHEENGQMTFFDHGAQNIKSANRVLENEIQTLGFRDRVFIKAPTCLRDGNQILVSNETQEAKWSCRGGLRNLPRALAEGLDIRLNTRVSCLENDGENFVLRDETNRVLDIVERVIVTFPAPQSADLLEASDAPNENDEAHAARIALLRSVEYSRCLSVLLRYETASDDLDFYALLSKNRDAPLLWLARENAKGFASDDSTALVAQLGHETSCALWDEDDEEIVRQTANWIREIEPRFVVPTWNFVKRWRYSQPRTPLRFEDANSAEDRVLVCGDGLSRARVTDAFESGQLAARWLLNGGV